MKKRSKKLLSIKEFGRKVRQAIADIGGTMPEKLPVAEDVVKMTWRRTRAINETAKKIK